MESRTRLAITGSATIAASIAVVCAVAVGTTGALADVPGAAISAQTIVVPSATPTPTPTPPATVAPAAPVEPAPVVTPTAAPIVETETVQAPKPRDVTVPASAAKGPSKRDERRILAEANASRSWKCAWEWAAKKGWDRERTVKWVKHLTSIMDEKASRGEYTDKWWTVSEPRKPSAVPTPTPTGSRTPAATPTPTTGPTGDKTSERDQSGLTSGSKREQSHIPPD